jgi:chemotaxis protein histidine kinase CheA
MKDVQVIRPPNSLRKAKVGNGPGKLDPEALRNAEAAVAGMEKDFTLWAAADMETLDAAVAALRGAGGRSKDGMAEIFRIALDMKGQGGSFGYQMITRIAGSLCDFLEGRHALNQLGMEAVSAHVAAMRAILAEDIRDNGGETGKALLDELGRLTAKASAA